MNLTLVNPMDAEVFWEVAEPFLKKGTENSYTVSIEELEHEVKGGYYQLWLISDDEPVAAFVTTIDDDDDCCILTLGGERMSEWLFLLDDLCDWARSHGAKKMILSGRKGWERKLVGFHVTRTTLEKVL